MKVRGFIKDNDTKEQSSPTCFYFSSIHIKLTKKKKLTDPHMISKAF